MQRDSPVNHLSRSFSNHVSANACEPCDCSRSWHGMMSSLFLSANLISVFCVLVGNVFLSSPFHFLSFDRFEPSFETYVDIQDWRVRLKLRSPCYSEARTFANPTIQCCLNRWPGLLLNQTCHLVLAILLSNVLCCLHRSFGFSFISRSHM